MRARRLRLLKRYFLEITIRSSIVNVLASTAAPLCATALAPAATAQAASLPLGKANFAIAIGQLNAASAANWVRLGQYSFSEDGTVSEQHWYWSQGTRVARADTGILARNCTPRDCNVLTAGGWQTTDAPQTYAGTYGVKGTRLHISWTGGLWENWTLSTLANGRLGNVEFRSSNFGATHGFGNGSNAAWDDRVPATSVAAMDHAKLVHRYYLWKTKHSPSTGYQGYVDHGDGTPFWVTRWTSCADERCLGAVTKTADGTTHTVYYIAPANNSGGHRRDTLWHWHTEHADDRGEYCYTGNSHVKPMIQVVDDRGGFHGWVGVEASLNQATPAGANDDDLGVYRILG